MVKTPADVVERYKINTEFFQNHVQHTKLENAKSKATVKGNCISFGKL